jgi:pimeloyl-ACP methyl ester carboxylesterase
MSRLRRGPGREIHYQVVGKGPPLVLLHPAGVASSIWYDTGYVDALAHQKRLVLVDAVGSGLSSKPHSTRAYALEERVAYISAVLDDLDLPIADIFGYSMGGIVAIAMAILRPQSVRRLIAGGAPPPGMQPPPPLDYVRAVPTDQGPEAYTAAAIARWKSVGIELSETSKKDLRSFDLKADSARKAVPTADLRGRLSSITARCLMIVGADDPFCGAVKDASTMIPDCVCKVLEGRSHIGAFADKDAIVSEMGHFLGGAD